MRSVVIKRLNEAVSNRTIHELNCGDTRFHEIIQTKGWKKFTYECSTITLDFITTIIECTEIKSLELRMAIDTCIEVFKNNYFESSRNRVCQKNVYDFLSNNYFIGAGERNPLVPPTDDDNDDMYGYIYTLTFTRRTGT